MMIRGKGFIKITSGTNKSICVMNRMGMKYHSKLVSLSKDQDLVLNSHLVAANTSRSKFGSIVN